eukprot:11160940-Lingulodinium_polyedra.AAC.1
MNDLWTPRATSKPALPFPVIGSLSVIHSHGTRGIQSRGRVCDRIATGEWRAFGANAIGCDWTRLSGAVAIGA